VLAATLDELTAGGFTALTIDNVARRAGVHKTSIYRNWNDRVSLIADALSENVAGGVQIPDTGSIETDLRDYAQSLIGWLTSSLGRAILAATMSDAARAEPEIAEIEQRFYVDRLRRARSMITRAVARGELPRDTDADMLIKTVLAPIYLRLLITAEPVDDATADQAARVALVAARAGVLSST
jgi:AcrR family transcriptional regulator